jgi:hypothetical protein
MTSFTPCSQPYAGRVKAELYEEGRRRAGFYYPKGDKEPMR